MARTVYSTDPDRQPCPACGVYPCRCPREAEPRPPAEQELRVRIDRSGRKGRTVTVVEGFVGPSAELADLAKALKKRCGAGGSVKDGVIEIQGQRTDDVADYLRSKGYAVR